MVAENRPGATAVKTPTAPGHVTFQNSPAGPRWRATVTPRPSPGNVQSRVRTSMGAPSRCGVATVQAHSYEVLMMNAPGPLARRAISTTSVVYGDAERSNQRRASISASLTTAPEPG